MDPVPLSIIIATVSVLAVSSFVWSNRAEPGNQRRMLAVGLAVVELVAGAILLLAGDVGTVQQATGAAFLAAAFIELGDAAKRSADAAEDAERLAPR